MTPSMLSGLQDAPAREGGGLTLKSFRAAVLMLGAIGSYQIAFEFPAAGFLVLGYVAALLALRGFKTARQAFYAGLLVGLGVFVPQTGFLWTIFGPAAGLLWLILAFFHAVFALLLNRVAVRFGDRWALALAPMLWCGIEYFRCEVWWLRFAWFAAGTPIVERTGAWVTWFGVYGLGFLAFAAMASFLCFRSRDHRGAWMVAGALLLLVVVVGFGKPATAPHRANGPRVAGIQLEFPGVPEVVTALNRLLQTNPEAELVLLSEYTFDGPVPEAVRSWCRRHQKWLVAGGKNPVLTAPTTEPVQSSTWLRRFGAQGGQDKNQPFFNTAFVVSTNGEVVFSQAKSRPIQFFADGLPAEQQTLWHSPWGAMGIAICYDLSYRNVTDRLVRQGASALLIPTMDVEAWGGHEHGLNARMARVRATEYGLPIFRVASSGISQLIDASGREIASAPVPGPGAVISGTLSPRDLQRSPNRIPWDQWLAPACCVGVLMTVAILCLPGARSQFSATPSKLASTLTSG